MITHQHSQPQIPDRIMLLGARGFIGSAIRRQAESQGIEVIAPSSAELDLSNDVAPNDLSGMLKPSDVVVMLAAVTPDKGRDNASLMKNLTMMTNVCAAIQSSGCAQFVYFSSDAVYGSRVSRVNEDVHVSPQDLYGAMHHIREIMARSMDKNAVLILRPTLVYGANDTHNSYGPNRFRRSARQSRKITLFGAGEEMRDHIHVDDVATLTLNCVLYKSSGTLNVATGNSNSFRDIASMVAEQFSESVDVINVPPSDQINHRHYDITSLIKAFPSFRFLGIEEGLARVHRQSVGEDLWQK
jgi:UDP-glucose 4-epimerase